MDLFGTGGVDKQVCGSHLGAVDHAFTSSDGKYDDGTATVPVTNNAKDFGTGPRVIDVLIRDDDQPGVRLGVRSLNALEGQPASYGTRLLSQPNADVTLNVSTGTVSAASVGDTQLTFTPADWDVEQTVTLDLGDDDVANGSRTLTVRHSLSSSDSRFNGLVDESMTVNIVDDDSPGVFLLASAVSVGEDGSSDGYELRLTSRPSAPVTVAVSGDGQATPDRSSLTFTAQNWDQAQRVNVTAVDDQVAEERWRRPAPTWRVQRRSRLQRLGRGHHAGAHRGQRRGRPGRGSARTGGGGRGPAHDLRGGAALAADRQRERAAWPQMAASAHRRPRSPSTPATGTRRRV